MMENGAKAVPLSLSEERVFTEGKRVNSPVEDTTMAAMLGVTYTPREAAKILKSHYQTVLQLIRTGRLPAARIGRSYVIRASAIANLLEDSESHVLQTVRANRMRSHSGMVMSSMPRLSTSAAVSEELDALCARILKTKRPKP